MTSASERRTVGKVSLVRLASVVDVASLADDDRRVCGTSSVAVSIGSIVWDPAEQFYPHNPLFQPGANPSAPLSGGHLCHLDVCELAAVRLRIYALRVANLRSSVGPVGVSARSRNRNQDLSVAQGCSRTSEAWTEPKSKTEGKRRFHRQLDIAQRGRLLSSSSVIHITS
jgi:hypothetical protein